MIRSYELGVLVTPETELAARVAVGSGNVTSVRLLHGVAGAPVCPSADPDHSDTGQVRSSSIQLICCSSLTMSSLLRDIEPQTQISWIPLPYELPPTLYGVEDIPWANDGDQHQPDCLGNLFVRGQLVEGPPVHDQAAGGHSIVARRGSGGSSVHERQYRQQQLQRQHQQKLRQQPSGQCGASSQHSTMRDTAKNTTNIAAQWSWKAGAGWQPYDSKTSAILEQCHGQFFACKHNGSDPGPFVQVEVGGGRHVNLATMQQVVTAAPGRTRHVRRRGPAPRGGEGGGGGGGKPVHSRDTWV